MMIHFRSLMAAGGAIALAALAFALVLQYAGGLEPCPMCIFQRIAMLALALVMVAAAVHNPSGGLGRGVYGVLAVAAAGAGGAIAARHVWLQNLPPDQVPACGPSLDYMLDVMPAWDAIRAVLVGDGNCAIIDASFLGLSLPAWTLLGFAALGLWAVAACVVPIVHQRAARSGP